MFLKGMQKVSDFQECAQGDRRYNEKNIKHLSKRRKDQYFIRSNSLWFSRFDITQMQKFSS